MKNPKTFSGATPFKYSKVIDKSHPNKEMKHNGTRPWTGPTPDSHSGKVAKSGYEGIGAPYAKSSDRTEMLTPANHFKKIDKSMPGVPVNVKKWHKRGRYDMTSPS